MSTGLMHVQEGTVVETGSHPELIHKGGLYSEMWSRQKDAAKIGRSASSASMSSVAASHAADGEGGQEGGRRSSRGVLGSLVGATQAMLGYGSTQSLGDANHHHH